MPAWKYGYVSLDDLLDWVRDHPLPSGRIIPVCVWGSRGVGKTQQIRAYCKSRNLEMKGYQPALNNTGAEVIGIPYLDEQTKETRYAMPTWLPRETQEGKDGGILFIDELNRAPLEVLQGLMELLGEGEISQIGWQLPENWSIVCAANPNEVGYQVNPLDMAMLNRMVNYAPGWNTAAWVNWADGANLPTKVVDFALQVPNRVASGEAELPHDVEPLATPRSLEYMGALYTPEMDLKMLDTIARGLIGEEAAKSLIDLHLDDDKPLRGEEVLGWKTANGQEPHQLIQKWTYDGRPDLIRGSTERAVSTLYGRAATESVAAENMWKWLMTLPEDFIGETIASMRESTPDWLDLIQKMHNGQFAARIPKNAAMIRKAGKLQLERELQQRTTDTEFARWVDDLSSAENGGGALPLGDDDLMAGL